MAEAHEQSENNAGIAGAWMLFVIFMSGSLLSAIAMFVLVFAFGISSRDVMPDFPVSPDYPMETPPSYPGTTGGYDDVNIPDTGLFGGDKEVDAETCAQLATMSNEQAYKLYQQYCLDL